MSYSHYSLLYYFLAISCSLHERPRVYRLSYFVSFFSDQMLLFFLSFCFAFFSFFCDGRTSQRYNVGMLPLLFWPRLLCTVARERANPRARRDRKVNFVGEARRGWCDRCFGVRGK